MHRPAFNADEDLLAAVDAGDCGIGIVSSRVAAKVTSGDPVHRFRIYEHEVFADIEAVGVVRHAHNPAGATALVEWLMNRKNQKRYSSKSFLSATSEAAETGKNVSLVARHEEDAIKLAERVQYR